MDCSTPGSSDLQSLLKLMSIESVMTSNHCCPLLLCSVFSSIRIFSRIRIFSNELAPCIRWPKYWSFSFSISLSNENSGLISFMVDWFDLLAVLGTPKSLLQVQVQWHLKIALLAKAQLALRLFCLDLKMIFAFFYFCFLVIHIKDPLTPYLASPKYKFITSWSPALLR